MPLCCCFAVSVQNLKCVSTLNLGKTCWGHTVAQLVEALCYKPEGRGFYSQWCHWNISLIYSFRLHYGHEVALASNRNEYQEYFLGGKGIQCVGLTNLPPSHADCCEIWEPQPPGTLRTCPGLYRDCFTFTLALPKSVVNIHFKGAQCSMKGHLFPFLFCGFVLFLV